jgi:hypothetical protein
MPILHAWSKSGGAMIAQTARRIAALAASFETAAMACARSFATAAIDGFAAYGFAMYGFDPHWRDIPRPESDKSSAAADRSFDGKKKNDKAA